MEGCAAGGARNSRASPGAISPAGPASTETLLDLSNAADTAIRAAHDFAWRQLVERHGAPQADDPEAQRLIVIAMGKLGGQELNFSSDVDLIFLFADHGETGGPQIVAHEEFFLKLGQRLIRYLDAPTLEGRAFRVDMRLRPFGASGPLVASTAAFEDYLERQGRDWERYAWIKARAITGAALYEQVYRSSVRPFVYRRYLDFGVFEALRGMKALIEREVERRELQDDIKLGPGGIREIEFIVQSLQLIRGGNERRLRSNSLMRMLPRLAGDRLLAAGRDRRAVGGLRVPAPAREPAADVPRPADARAAGGRRSRARGCARPWISQAGTSWSRRSRPSPARGRRTSPRWCSWTMRRRSARPLSLVARGRGSRAPSSRRAWPRSAWRRPAPRRS